MMINNLNSPMTTANFPVVLETRILSYRSIHHCRMPVRTALPTITEVGCAGLYDV